MHVKIGLEFNQRAAQSCVHARYLALFSFCTYVIFPASLYRVTIVYRTHSHSYLALWIRICIVDPELRCGTGSALWIRIRNVDMDLHCGSGNAFNEFSTDALAAQI